MALSSELISQFAKLAANNTKDKKESTVYGTVVEYNKKKYVKLDGSELLTPVESTAKFEDGERVTVMIKNHTATVTGNISSPSARTDEVEKIGSKISEFEVVMAYKVTTEELEAINATFTSLSAKVANISNISADELKAVNAKIETLMGTYADLKYVSTKDVTALNADIDNLKADIANITAISTEELDAINADIDNLTATNADFFYVSTDKLTALKAEIKTLETDKLSVEDAKVKYANIDFANITEAAIKKIFSDTGIIKDLIVQDGSITGELVGVTIKGDIIEGGTVKADKLVVKGSDGLFYKLNIDAMGETTTEQVPTDSLHGSVITAKSITADKVRVTDLVAFGATIGGFQIKDHSLYSGTKSSATNTTRGVYFGDAGEFAVGDSSNYFRYYKDENGYYRLEISAASIKIGSSSKSIEDELNEIKDNVTTNLRIESSRGTVFKNDNVSTVLSAVIYRGSQRITNITDLRAAMGSSAYLQWKWQRMDEETFGVILSTDSRLGNDGFTFALSPDDVDTKVTFMCELIA